MYYIIFSGILWDKVYILLNTSIISSTIREPNYAKNDHLFGCG